MKTILLLFLAMHLPNIFSASVESELGEDFSLYIKTISPGSKIRNIPSTPQNIFYNISETIKRGGVSINGVAHQNISFGRSFFEKNQAPVNSIARLLTGKSEWCRSGIECVETKMADIGCGLGVSAVNLIAQVVDIYEAEKWILDTPIQFDLFDIDPDHQPILRALARIVNAAYPQYFRITTGVRDVTEFVGVDKHDIVFSLHSMHYIPESKWPLAVSNIEETMKENAILLITTDYAKKSDELFFTLGVSLDELVIITNKRCDFLNADTAYEPGKICDSTMIDPNRFRETIESEGVTVYRNTPGRLTPESIRLNEIMERLKRTRTLVLWQYCFNERSLPTAIMQSIPADRLEITPAGWTSELLKNLDGSPASAGIQLAKKSSVAEA